MPLPRLIPSLLILAITAAAPLAPAIAQRGESMLVIYGSDKCPTSSGQEIVVCVRRSENERYRIPPQLRQSDPLYNRTWADRAEALEYVGASGVSSCSPVGSGGASGCHDKLIRQAREEDKANGKEANIKF